MSPRSKRLRKVFNPPIIKGLKPYGLDLENNKNSTSVILLFEEYEALRLCDYDMYNHHQASVMMGISRPTFTRIYAAARQKIAKALVEGSHISIEGGKVYFDSDWYHCKNCTCYFNNPEKEKAIKHCPICKSPGIINYELQDEWLEYDHKRCHDLCVCPGCGHEQTHEYRKPCGEQICPKCNTRMIRRGMPGRGSKNKNIK